MSVDPLAAKFAGWSSYNYVMGNPIKYIDPDGKEAVVPPLIVAGIIWAGIEVGLSIYDAYDVVTTVTDPDATTTQKVTSVGGAAAGLILPGGGYSAADDVVEGAIRISDNVADDVIKQVSQKGTDAHKAAKADIAKESGEGIIYKVDGSNTPTGKPYVGSADDLSKRAQTATDGRNRTSKTEVVGGYEKGNKTSRRTAEQQAIIDEGGVKNLDNKRNEIKASDWKKYGIEN